MNKKEKPLEGSECPTDSTCCQRSVMPVSLESAIRLRSSTCITHGLCVFR